LCLARGERFKTGNPHFLRESHAELLARANKDSPALVQKFATDTRNEDSKQNRW
jgi:hypothetical protein